MEVELREDFSTPNPADAVVMAARGDQMEESLIGKTDELRVQTSCK